MFIVVRQN